MEWLCAKVSDYTSEELENTYANLSASRKERIDRFSKREDAVRSLVGEALLKQLLSAKFGIKNAVIESAPNGRPFLPNENLCVSISHACDKVVCAAGREKLGIDIEHIKPVKTALIKRVCVEEELEYVFGDKVVSENMLCENTEILTRFFEIWTAKEAYFKKCGTGITNFKSVNILPLKRRIFHIDDYLVQIVTE